ncbi:protein of unknown function [Pararobbsia alpina]|uniref:hypothetical protein n=1 Tax=Pararobbsia alpina TaxID=621374 RepID=UPI0039A4748B
MAMNESSALHKQLLAIEERALQTILRRVQEAAERGQFDGIVAKSFVVTMDKFQTMRPDGQSATRSNVKCAIESLGTKIGINGTPRDSEPPSRN